MSEVVFGFVPFTASKQGKTGLSVSGMVNVIAAAKANLAPTQIVTNGNAVELGFGMYGYRLTGADRTANFYLAVFTTADATVDAQQLWVEMIPEFAAPGDVMGKSPATLDWSADVSNPPTIGTSTLDSAGAQAAAAAAIMAAGVSTFNPASDVVALASGEAATVAGAVWDEATADHANVGSTGKALADAGAAGNPWEAPERTLTESLPSAVEIASALHAQLGSSNTFYVVSPVVAQATIVILPGTDYYAADGQALTWTDAYQQWPDLAGATIALSVGNLIVNAPGTVIIPTGVKVVRVELSRAVSALLTQDQVYS